MSEKLINQVMNHPLVEPVLTNLAKTDALILAGHKFVMEPRVKPGGLLTAARFNRALRRREKASVSRFRGIFNGYEIHSEGSSNLYEASLGAVCALNYPAEKGPYNTLWGTFLASSEIMRATGKEMTWIQSYGDNYNPNPFTGEWHRIVANTIDAIEIGDPNEPQYKAKRKIIEALQKEKILGVYMEGEPSPQLKQALPESANTVLLAARMNKPTIAAAMWKDGDHFYISRQLIRPSSILILADSLKGNDRLHQTIADYVMKIIALQMPEDLRGFYKKFVPF